MSVTNYTVGFRFQDSTDLFPMAFPSKFDPELGKVGERIVFVENAETGLMEPKGAGYSTQVAIDDDDLDEDSHLLGKLDGSFPGEEDPLYGWGTSVGHREGRDGQCDCCSGVNILITVCCLNEISVCH